MREDTKNTHGGGGGPAAHQAAWRDYRAQQNRLQDDDASCNNCWYLAPLSSLAASLTLFAYTSRTSEDQSPRVFQTPIILLIVAMILCCCICLAKRESAPQNRRWATNIYSALQETMHDQFDDEPLNEKDEETPDATR